MSTILIQPSGKWRARVRVNGHPAKSRTFRTKQLAQIWANHLEDELVLGLHVGDNIPENYTVGDLLHWYERAMTKRKKGRDVESTRIAMFTKKLGHVLLKDLSPLSIMALVDERLQSVCSDTVRRELTVLSAAIEAGITLKDFKFDNPVKIAIRKLVSTNTLTSPVKRDRRLVGDEYSKILEYLGKDNAVMADVITLLVESAMRRGELVKYRGDHLRADGLLIADDKMGKTTVIPLSSKARAILERYPNGFGLKGDSISDCFRRACRRLGFKDLRLHDLRHEAASRLFEKSLDVQQVSTITRQSWAVLEKYTHPKNKDIEKLLG